MNADDMPLPINSAPAKSPEEIREHLRFVYSNAISDIIDRCLGDVLLPNDAATICLDVAQFTTFMMAVKIVEIRGQPTSRENLMAAYWPMQKALKDEVPGMLRQVAEATSGPVQGRA